MSKQIEVSIDITDVPDKHVEGLILGLVHAGYPVYFNYEKDQVCFTGDREDLITEIKTQ